VGHFPASGGGGGSGTIEEIESTDGSITVTGPTGPITDLTGAGAAGVASFNTRTGAVVPASGDYTVAEVTGAAPLASPALTGTPTAPTGTTGDNTTQIATDQFVQTASGLLLPKTGGAMSGAIAMGANKITGLANGTTGTDAAAFGQIASALGAQLLVGLLAAIPASTGGGHYYYATDDNGGRLWVDTGSGPLNGGWQPDGKAGELYGAQMTTQFAVPSTTFGASSIFMVSPTVQVYTRPIKLTCTFAMLAALSTTRFQIGFSIDGSNAGSGAWFFWNLNLTPASQQDTRTVSLILGGAQAVGQGGHTFGVYALAQVITTSIIDATAGRPVSFIVEEV